jgi:hypothetical protein
MADIESFSLAQARQSGLKFDALYQFPLPSIFRGDMFRIRQALYN